MTADLDGLKQLLVDERGVCDVTTDHSGFHIQTRTEEAAKALRSRFQRYHGVVVRVTVAPMVFLGSPVVSRKLDTGETHQGTRGIFHIVISRCVGEREYKSALFVYGYSLVIQLPKRKTVWRALLDAELQAQAFGRVVRSALRGVAPPRVPQWKPRKHRCRTGASSVSGDGSASCQ